MNRSIALVLGLALATSAAADPPKASPLLGSWRLVAAIPGSMEDSSPNGIRNLRIRFGSDGKAVLVDPNETLATAKARNDYSFEGNTLTLHMGEGEEMHGAVQSLPGDGVRITYAESGMSWSLRRIPDADIQSKKLAPESVQYIPPATLQAVEAFKYDDSDDSTLPLAQRFVGQWEVVEISGYGGGDFPPYGAPNEVWQFDGKRVTRFSPYDKNGEHGMMDYSVRGPYLLFGGEGEQAQPTPYRFDEWHRLVVGETDGQHTVMKRINRDGKGKVTMPPLRIILGYPRGSGSGE